MRDLNLFIISSPNPGTSDSPDLIILNVVFCTESLLICSFFLGCLLHYTKMLDISHDLSVLLNFLVVGGVFPMPINSTCSTGPANIPFDLTLLTKTCEIPVHTPEWRLNWAIQTMILGINGSRKHPGEIRGEEVGHFLLSHSVFCPPLFPGLW